MKKKIVKFRKRKDIPKLDFGTNLFLSYINAKKVSHPSVRKIDKKLHMYVNPCDVHDVYVFNNFDEYRDFYLMYFDSIDDTLIDLAVITHGNKGQVVALKSLVNLIIIRKQTCDFLDSITDEMIDKIHEKGNLTPFDILDYWEENDICPPATSGLIEKGRCDFFTDCEDCRKECVRNHMEYIPPKNNMHKGISPYVG